MSGGATFVVDLPLAIVHGAQEPAGVHPRTFTAPPPEINEERLRGLRLLVVDDETDALELTQRVLEEYGADVVTVASAAEGLALLEAQTFDVLISDIGMPRKDGYEFIGDVRRQRAAHAGRGVDGVRALRGPHPRPARRLSGARDETRRAGGAARRRSSR